MLMTILKHDECIFCQGDMLDKNALLGRLLTAKWTSTYISSKSLQLGLQACQILLLIGPLHSQNVAGNAVWACCGEIVCLYIFISLRWRGITCWEELLGSSLEALANNRSLSHINISIHNRLRRVNISSPFFFLFLFLCFLDFFFVHFS